jgi:hypothetical protein
MNGEDGSSESALLPFLLPERQNETINKVAWRQKVA